MYGGRALNGELCNKVCMYVCMYVCRYVCNELVKVWEEGSLVAIVKIVKGTPEQDNVGREYEKIVLHKEDGQFLHFLKPSLLPSE